MIIEQAFFIMPEVLCGSRYPNQEYESGLVMALTMSILQELNGRNLSNPLSCINGEQLYDISGFGIGRWLRADLVLDSSTSMVANKKLGNHYGWRHKNWLEAKFMRKRTSESSHNKTQVTANILADIIRLSALVPEGDEKTSNARFLLHVYDSHPSKYLSYRRNGNATTSGFEREWARKITQPNREEITIENLHLESKSIKDIVGHSFSDLKIELITTTRVIEPVNPDETKKLYWCYLTRLDKITVTMDGDWFRIRQDRTIEKSSAEGFDNIRNKIASGIGNVSEFETEQPDADEEAEPDGEAG